MWYELIEMVEQRCRCDDVPRSQRTKAALSLYGGLINCEEAFIRYKQNHSAAALANTAFAIDGFISMLVNLNSSISLFEPELTTKLAHYSLEENRGAYSSNTKELLKKQIGLLHSIVNSEIEAIPLLSNDLSDFTGAKTRFSRFIMDTFSCNELFVQQ